jgi:two-component system, LytTR family, response regulator
MLKLSTCKGTEFINTDSIIRIEAQSNYSKFYFDNGKTLLVAKVLCLFEHELPIATFIRTHRKHLVNKNFIKGYKDGKIMLINLQKIDVARRKKVQFLNSWINIKAS